MVLLVLVGKATNTYVMLYLSVLQVLISRTIYSGNTIHDCGVFHDDVYNVNSRYLGVQTSIAESPLFKVCHWSYIKN